MPKAKITKEMVIDAAFEVTRTEGIENVNARTVSQKLGCSTQPVLYYFDTIKELKKAVYKKLDWYHAEYLVNFDDTQENEVLRIGLNYIRFAIKEPYLFKFLFQSGFAVENDLIEMVNSEELKPAISIMQKTVGMGLKQTKKIFLMFALFAHGYASIIANNSLEYDEKVVIPHLELAYRGAVLAVQEEEY